jgi:hypothetical protein
VLEHYLEAAAPLQSACGDPKAVAQLPEDAERSGVAENNYEHRQQLGPVKTGDVDPNEPRNRHGRGFEEDPETARNHVVHFFGKHDQQAGAGIASDQVPEQEDK